MVPVAPTLVILAAGMGKRYGGLKQIEGMGPGGETLLDYSVFDAQRAGFAKVVFVIRREFADQFRDQIAARFSGFMAVELALQDQNDLPRHLLPAGFAPARREKPWGTGHAALAARHAIKEPFGVINADDFYGRASFVTMAEFLAQPGLAGVPCRNCMVAFTMRHTLSEHGTVARGVCTVSPEGHLQRVEELTDLVKTPAGASNRPAKGDERTFTGDEPVSLNMWGFTPRIFSEFERVFASFLTERGHDPKAEFYIPFALDQLIQEGREQCRVLRSHSEWFGVTYREDVAHVRESLRRLHEKGHYPEEMWKRSS
ncbi:MAG: nucleotidyltransferase family protein [Verrucomicrobiales bacterium]